MTDSFPSTATQYLEPQLKMSLPQSHKYRHNINQDIQMQVIMKENDSLCTTKLKTSPASATRAPDFTSNDNIINVQYGKLHLNQCRDFRVTPPQMNNENSYGHLTDSVHHPPMSILTSEKPGSRMKCLDSTYLNKTFRNLIVENHLDRIWNYIKWPLLLFFLCTFIGFITYTCVISLNRTHMVLKCINSSTSVNRLVTTKTDRSESESLELLLQSETTTSDEEATEAVLKGSTTLLRPVIFPQLLQARFRENDPKSDYKLIDRKQNQEHRENKDSTSTGKESSYGPEPDRSTFKDQTDTLNLLGFTSGHQNNFGVPIEEDERVLKLLNEELIRLEHQTEASKIIGRTESSVKVSPTVPLILHDLEISTSSPKQTEELQCQSTSLAMCRGVLQYDLTSFKSKGLQLGQADLKVFEQFVTSNCSARSAEFVCSALEPECRPTQIGSLQPCKRICKSILEACSSLIVSSDILTYTFDCDKYPDSDDTNVCEDPTRRKDCYEHEFKCDDLSCIPNQWQCDNIKDCSDGEDELGCLICNPEEFRCRSNDKCLEDKYRCDMNEDCVDGSDELDCLSENDEDDPLLYPRIFSFASFLPLNNSNENLFTVISEDRLALGSELNESLTLNGGSLGAIAAGVLGKGELSNGSISSARNLANFQDSKEIMMTSDSENKLKVSQNTNATEKTLSAVQSEVTTSCVGDQLRCVSGKCITVDQLCDKVVDCPEGEDELMCTYVDHPQPKKP